ncbi:MAG: SpoIIE family protein phosphatase [Selenomonadaceae bacterium]|nr:SpoIIE family protein phosphatase [Selenomonadaceae bacterium]
MRRKILTGGMLFTLILAIILSYNSYQRFTAIIMQAHEEDALRTAKIALTFLDADNFFICNQNTLARQKILYEWQKIVDTQDATFIYVIEPYNDYNNIRFGVNVKSTASNPDYVVRPIGYAMATSNDEYKKAYKNLYDGSKEYAFVMRDNGISLVGDHITAMVPIKNSKGVVEGILCVQWQLDELDEEKILFLKHRTRTLLIYLAVILLIGGKYLNAKLLNPLTALTQGVKEISDGNLNKKLEIKTGDELQTLAENFNTMTDELKRQMANLTKVTAERERIATELDVATRIQMSMLPKNFSVDKRVDLFATMTPAKEVGGDLYDFYKTDDNHLFVTIADVSGKGVPAALFMVAAITNLRNYTSALKNPDELKLAIENTNDRLCANNDGGLFVTAFSGVLDLTTGIFRYVNAGHNPPLIRRRGQNFEELPMELNFVLGGWEDWQYVQQEIQLQTGDTIFFYTDGVTEAVDSTGKLYSLERLQKFLNELDKNLSAEEILSEVRKSLENFSVNAEQSDDITMLAIKFEGRH